MGIVYQARQISLNRRVALKVLPPGLGMTSSAVVRFHREAQAAAKLHHSNIVAVYSEGEQDEICFYAMELIEGKGLDQIIAEWRHPDVPTVSLSAPTVTVGATPPPSKSVRASGSSVSSRTSARSTREHFDTIAKWVADAADALDYAHGQGVIHRDIKPSNLMLGGDGRLSVMDFGLARMLEEPGMTVSGEFLGTPRYMSPEQITAGRAKLDHRTDIYSLGVTLYELMTQQPLFPGEHRDEIIAAIMAKEPTRPRQVNGRVPVDLETICLKAIEKDPDRRYQTAGEFSEDLRHYLHRDTIAARRAGPLRRIVKFAHRHKAPAAVAATVLFVASISGGLAWKYWPEPRLSLIGLTPLTSDPGLTTEPALSPDGVLLAYASDRGGNDNLDIWVQPVAGGEPRQLTSDAADDREPAFAPDGQTIVFRSERDGGGLYIMPAAAGEQSTPARLLAPLGRRPRFSPDGTFVAYWVGRRGVTGLVGREGKVFVVPAADGSPTQLQSHFSAARSPIWSPDGEHILFLGFGTRSPTASSEARKWDWWLAPLEPGPAVRTGAFNAFRAQGISGLPLPGPWLPRENRVIFSGVSGGARKLWSLPVSAETGTVTGSLQRLTSGTGQEVHPWATSGGRVVFANRISNIDVWNLPIQANEGNVTGEPERLTDNPAIDARPFLSADGTTRVFESIRSGNPDVWMMDLQTRIETPLAEEPSHEFAPFIIAD